MREKLLKKIDQILLLTFEKSLSYNLDGEFNILLHKSKVDVIIGRFLYSITLSFFGPELAQPLTLMK